MNEKASNVQLTPFTFDERQVRVIQGEDGEPRFVAKDVAEALGYVWKGQSGSLGHVPEEWKGVCFVQTPSGRQQMAALTEQGLYFFVARSDKPKALPFQKWLAGEVLPAIRQTGGYQLPAARPDQARLTGELALLECFCTLNNPAPSSRVVLLEKIGSAHGLNTAWLPGYVEDGPEAGQGSLDTDSATALLAEFGVRITAAVFNQRLAAMGILERRNRKARSGTKAYWCVTDKGQAYGKNITAPQSPRETQPHWYRDRFLDLLALVGMKGAA
ncbi:BRO-N domain-containing protein [Halomonas sp. E14]|uniref:BRO-N domain-containing protein n=1 Tax=Halomonas sp. E14 TaxID=3397245 RepID=UPI00403EDC04